jgi:predicted negative regulator of RcsB-dependent stress response
MGKYSDAKTWIEKSLEHGSENSAAVLEHYGDVLYRLGDTDGAVQYWIRARDTGEPGSDFLERKINEKKLFE